MIEIVLEDFSSGDVTVSGLPGCHQLARLVRDRDVPGLLADVPKDALVTQLRAYSGGSRQLTVGELLADYQAHGAWGW